MVSLPDSAVFLASLQFPKRKKNLSGNENAYFEELTSISSNQGTNTIEQSMEEELNEEEDDAEDSEDEIPEYESESDVEENDEGHVDCVTNIATFLVATSSKFGRSIKLNEKCIA